MPPPIRTVDYHTAGEPFRIVADPPVEIPGDSVADRRARALDDPAVDGLRRILCFEPRGHADMYGGFLVPPDDDGADLGVLFWHKDGFSTACGHGTIALGVWALETGLVRGDPDGTTDVVVDVPSGRVVARVHCTGGRPRSVDFVNVPSHLVAADVELVTSRGPVRVDVGFGGATYVQLRAADVGLRVDPAHLHELIAVGREVKALVNETGHARHLADDRLSGVYGVVLYDDLGRTDAGDLHQRNVTVFADGEVDRSPCGSGTASRVAVLDARGELEPGRTLVHDSIIGSRFLATVLERVDVDGTPAVVPQVTGMAYRCGSGEFTVDDRDDLVPGFVLR